MANAIIGENTTHVFAQCINPIERAISFFRIANADPAQPIGHGPPKQFTANPVDVSAGKIGMIARNQRSMRIGSAIVDSSLRQHPGTHGFNDVGTITPEDLSHRASAPDEAIVRAAADLFCADLHPDVAALLDHPVLGA
jgi:hypothetical protein